MLLGSSPLATGTIVAIPLSLAYTLDCIVGVGAYTDIAPGQGESLEDISIGCIVGTSLGM